MEPSFTFTTSVVRFIIITIVIIIVMLCVASTRATDGKVGDIALKKCWEYSKLIYTNEFAPVLSVTNNRRSEKASKCGVVETKLIVGGQRVNNQLEFPHMAALGYNSSESNTSSYEFNCGGSVISSRYVLTAAHCGSDQISGKPDVVLVGVLDTENSSNGKLIKVDDFIPHPDYKISDKYNDIALVRLTLPIKFDERIRPACLAHKSIPPSKFIAIGFGKMGFEDDKGSHHLNKVILSHVDRSTCERTYQNYKPLKMGIIESQFCAGENDGKKDTCLGDSGGPLQVVMKEPYCMYEIFGVTSFGKFCGFANSYGVYTNVTSYIDFIEKTVWHSSSEN